MTYTSDSNSKQTEQVVSIESYVKDLPEGAKRSFKKSIRKNCSTILPNPDELLIGDIILTRGDMRKPHAKTIKAKQEEAGFPLEDCEYTHSMIYVGKLHIAESVVIWSDIRRRILYQSGVRIVPISKAIGKNKIKVMRAEKAKEEEFDILRMKAGNYALLDYAINRRVYNIARAAEMGAPYKLHKKILGYFSKLREGKKSVICSHYVLECIALGMGIKPRRFLSLTHGREEIFPAEFAQMQGLEEIIPSYVSVKN